MAAAVLTVHFPLCGVYYEQKAEKAEKRDHFQGKLRETDA